ncbi:hypothetical protein JCM8097_007122 [Rhodosporidiobolus ruineniae]
MSPLPTSVWSLELTTAQSVLLAVLASIALLLFKYRDGRAIGTRPRPDLYTVPGQQIPLLGDLVTMVKNQNRALERFLEIHRNHADELAKDPSRAVSMTAPGRRMIEVSNPDHLEWVQKTHFQNYVKGELFYRNLTGLLGDGIFCVDGAHWQLQRKTTAKLFTGNNFKTVISKGLEHNLQRLVTIIDRHAQKGEAFDLSDLFFRFTLASFTEFAFGQDIGALSTETDAPVPFAKAFDEGQVVMNQRFTNPFWPILERLNGTHVKMQQATEVIDNFAYGIIDQREREGLGNWTGGEKKEAAQTDMLSLYMSLRDDQGAPLSRKMLRDSMLNLIIAGRDTTAQALSWTFFHLLLHPERGSAMHAEVDALAEEAVADFESFRGLVQTTAVFQEGLRLHPSVPKNAWEAVGDDQIPNGPRVEKGDIVFWSDWAMARDPSIWGPTAGEFDPQRWVDEKGELRKESQWRAHMFNGGYRICLGQQLATYEATSVLATLFRQFDFTFAPGYLDSTPMCESEYTPRYKGALTLSMDSPLMVKATKRAMV